jgi:hypothetical protein
MCLMSHKNAYVSAVETSLGANQQTAIKKQIQEICWSGSDCYFHGTCDFRFHPGSSNFYFNVYLMGGGPGEDSIRDLWKFELVDTIAKLVLSRKGMELTTVNRQMMKHIFKWFLI